MGKPVTGIYMVVLLQKDLAKAVSFYRHLFELVMYTEGKWAEFKAGGLRIGLCPMDEQGLEGVRYTGLVFKVDDVYALYARRDELGLNCHGSVPYKGNGGIVFSCSDVSGNHFDFFQEGSFCCSINSEKEKKDFCCKTKNAAPQK